MAVVDGSKWIGLDPATGRPQGPSIELGFAPVQPVQYADLDGDGTVEVLALEPGNVVAHEPLTDPTWWHSPMATGERLWARRTDVLLQTNARGSGATTGRWRPTSTATVAPRSWFPHRRSVRR